jgi:hypothetical protein
MRFLLIVAFLVISIGTSNSQNLNRSYESILDSLNHPDAEIIRITPNEISARWHGAFVDRYFFDSNGDMYLFISFEPSETAEFTETLLAGTSVIQLTNINYIDGIPHKIYQSTHEYEGYYRINEDITVIVRAKSIAHVTEATQTAVSVFLNQKE